MPRKPGPRRRNTDAQGKQPGEGEPSGAKQNSGEERSTGLTSDADKEATAGKSRRWDCALYRIVHSPLNADIVRACQEVGGHS